MSSKNHKHAAFGCVIISLKKCHPRRLKMYKSKSPDVIDFWIKSNFVSKTLKSIRKSFTSIATGNH